MKTWQEVIMPEAGKEKGIETHVPVFRYDMEIETIKIPNFCNIEKIIILYGDRLKTKEVYEKRARTRLYL